LIGTTRSGSSLHSDPLETSAWNALLKGKKRWVILHPELASEVESGSEGDTFGWFLEEWPVLRDRLEARDQVGMWFEFNQEETETVYIPRGL